MGIILTAKIAAEMEVALKHLPKRSAAPYLCTETEAAEWEGSAIWQR